MSAHGDSMKSWHNISPAIYTSAEKNDTGLPFSDANLNLVEMYIGNDGAKKRFKGFWHVRGQNAIWPQLHLVIDGGTNVVLEDKVSVESANGDGNRVREEIVHCQREEYVS